MSILGEIKSASTHEVTHAGVDWKIQRITSAHLAKVGFAWLNMVTPHEKPSKDKSKENDLDLAAMFKTASEGQMVELARLKDAVVAAGLIGVGRDGQWEPVRVTLRNADEDLDGGVMWIGSLPADVDNKLFDEIMKLSTDGGRAADVLSGFRRQSRNADSVGPNSAPIRARTAPSTEMGSV